MASSTPAKNTDNPSVSDKDAELFAAVFRSLETEPVINLDILQKQMEAPSKAAARQAWYRVRQKYMPQSVQPRKRKGDGHETGGAGDEGGEDEDQDVKPKMKSPRKNKVKGTVKTEPEAKIEKTE